MRIALLLLSFSIGAAAELDPQFSRPGILHTVGEIRETGNQQAKAHQPVRLEGVVTYSDPEWGLLFVQDKTGSLFIDAHNLGRSFLPGTSVRVTGITEAGDVAPTVANPQLKELGQSRLPMPEAFALSQLASGTADSKYIITKGVLRPGRADLDRISFRIFDGNTSVLVTIPKGKSVASDRLLGATVKLRGVDGIELNKSGVRIGAQVFVNSLNDIAVEKPADASPLAAAPLLVKSIGSMFAKQRFHSMVHIRGTVTWVRSGLFCLEDSTGTICVQPAANSPVQAGVSVDVAGYPSVGRYGLILSDALVQYSGTGSRQVTAPLLTTAVEVDKHSLNAVPVRVSGRLIEQLETAHDHIFRLQSGIPFTAMLAKAGPDSTTIRLPVGSILDISGVVVNEGHGNNSRFVVQVLSQSDIVTARSWEWLTARRALLALGSFLLSVIAVVLWVTQLRALVRRQTATIEARLLNELQLEKEYRRLFERNLAAVFRWKPDGEIIDCNQSFAKMLGYSTPDQVLGQSYWNLGTDRDEKQHIQSVLADGGISNRDATLRREDGGLLCLLANITPVHNSDGVFYETTALDVTQLRRNQADLQLAKDNAVKLALNDSLTGLPNRRLFSERLATAMAPDNACSLPLALLYLDLDGFKLVNDTFGHSTGDELLVQVASRIKTNVGDNGQVSRLAGDEFTVVIMQPEPEKLALIGRNLLSELARPFKISDHDIIIGGSIGISLFPGDATCPELLLQHADTAMYAAKRRGRSRVEFFTPELGELLRERTSLEFQLRGAIPRGEISVHYQPEFDLASNNLIRFEALARWTHPTLGSVSPGAFIPVAEESGLIVALGAFVMEQACRQAVEMQRQSPTPIQIAVNVSSVQLRRDGFVEEVAGVLRSTGLKPELLQLELTESVMLGGIERSAETMRRLKALGVSLAIDDFGTGYSSLGYLHTLPFDALKIDRAFVSGVDSKPESAAIIRSIVALAQNIGLQVIVEGVETPLELEAIRRIGGHEVQGYLLGRPTGDPAAFIATNNQSRSIDYLESSLPEFALH